MTRMTKIEADVRPLGETLAGVAHGDTLGTVLISLVKRLSEAAARRRLEARRRWLRHTTEAEMANLSPELKKDIGWSERQR